jgi:hypothetical protein
MTATFIFEGEAETLPAEEAFRKAFALTSQGYSEILRLSKNFVEIEIYKEVPNAIN